MGDGKAKRIVMWVIVVALLASLFPTVTSAPQRPEARIVLPADRAENAAR